MALLTQKIAELNAAGSEVEAGTYTFQDLIGQVLASSNQIETFKRRGVDGSGIRVLNSSPPTFTLRSTTYLDSFSDAKDAIAAYKELKGKEFGVKLTKDSLDYGSFDVIAVEEVGQPRQVLAKLSGVATTAAKVRQVCSWTLQERP